MLLGRSAGQCTVHKDRTIGIDHTFKISTKRIAIPARLADSLCRVSRHDSGEYCAGSQERLQCYGYSSVHNNCLTYYSILSPVSLPEYGCCHR
jgi:hypothetical protein